jgi:hypothetical protein
MPLQRVSRPTVRWAMDLGPIDELFRFLVVGPMWAALGLGGGLIGVAIGKAIAGGLGL